MDGKNILIIEDEFPMRYLIEYSLKKAGFSIHLAKDGTDGMKLAQTLQPDLIILDVMMPGMSGFDVCTKIKADPTLNHIPVIFLSANETSPFRERAFEVGADDYLTKPFQEDELVAHITGVLRRLARLQTGIIRKERGQIVSLFSPKGGVGTSTLAIQLAESMVIQEDRPVLLADLDLPLGGIGPMLYMESEHNIVDLLRVSPNRLSMQLVEQVAQHRRADMLVITAPGAIMDINTTSLAEKLPPLLQILTDERYLIILDCGSKLTPLVRSALQQSDFVFAITSGQPLANRLLDEFIASAGQMGIEPQRLMPVVNELHGRVEDILLARVPVARIPHASERSRSQLWLKEQGMRKLVSLLI